MTRAERRAAWRAEHEAKEAAKRRPKGARKPVADRLTQALGGSDKWRVESYADAISTVGTVTAKLYRAGEFSHPPVTFRQRYADKVTGYDRGKPVLEVTLHETPSERLLQFGIELADVLQEEDTAVLNPGDTESHEVITADPDRVIEQLSAAGAVVTDLWERGPGKTAVEFTLSES